MDLRQFATAVPFDDTFDARLGFEYDHIGPERVTGHFDARAELLDRAGAVALGVFTSVAEGSASMGTAAAVVPQGMAASGLSNDTTVTAAVGSGRIAVEARR